MNEPQFLIGNQGFDCVIKSFRAGRVSRRKHWPEGDTLSWDYREMSFIYYSSSSDTSSHWDPDYLARDVMANDWEVYVL